MVLLGGGAGRPTLARALALVLALGGGGCDLREHVRLAQDQHLVGTEPKLGTAVLREDDLVAYGDVHRYRLASLLAATTRAERKHTAALRLLPRAVREDDPTPCRLLLLEDLDDQTISKRLQIHHAIGPNSLTCGGEPAKRVHPMHSGPLCKSERNSEPRRLPR